MLFIPTYINVLRGLKRAACDYDLLETEEVVVVVPIPSEKKVFE